MGKKKRKSSKRSKKKFSFGNLILKFLFFILILIGLLFGYYFVTEDFNYEKALYKWKNAILLKPEKANILVLGISTDISNVLTDTIMICSYDPNNQNAYMLSIPRDTFIGDDKNNARGNDKLNAVYAKEGIDGVIEKVENITGIDINYYVVVKNDALIEIVDSIGGVDFDVPIDMDYDDDSQNLHIHLKAGNQHLDGEGAEGLVRFRHNNDGSSYPGSYGDNDFGRMRTQREFIKETAKQTLSAKNIFNVNKVLGAIFRNVETDMGVITGLKYAPSTIGFDTNSIKAGVLPGEAKKINSIWFFEYNDSKTKELISEFEN